MADLIAEAVSQAEEDAAFAAGAKIVIRLDLLPGAVPEQPADPGEPVKLRLEFSGDFMDTSAYARAVSVAGAPVLSGGMADFSAAGSRLSVQDAPSLRFGDADFEISFDLKMKAAPSSTHSFLCSKGAIGSLNAAWYFAVLAGGKLTFAPANNATGIYVTYAYASDYSTAHRIALRRTSGLVEALVDGVVVGACTPGSGSLPAIYEGVGPFLVGGWSYSTSNVRGDCIDNFTVAIG